MPSTSPRRRKADAMDASPKKPKRVKSPAPRKSRAPKKAAKPAVVSVGEAALKPEAVKSPSKAGLYVQRRFATAVPAHGLLSEVMEDPPVAPHMPSHPQAHTAAHTAAQPCAHPTPPPVPMPLYAGPGFYRRRAETHPVYMAPSPAFHHHPHAAPWPAAPPTHAPFWPPPPPLPSPLPYPGTAPEPVPPPMWPAPPPPPNNGAHMDPPPEAQNHQPGPQFLAPPPQADTRLAPRHDPTSENATPAELPVERVPFACLCDGCHSFGAARLHNPVDGGRFCDTCVAHFLSDEGADSGTASLSGTTVCYVCGQDFFSAHGLRQHINTKGHKKTLARLHALSRPASTAFSAKWAATLATDVCSEWIPPAGVAALPPLDFDRLDGPAADASGEGENHRGRTLQQDLERVLTIPEGADPKGPVKQLRWVRYATAAQLFDPSTPFKGAAPVARLRQTICRPHARDETPCVGALGTMMEVALSELKRGPTWIPRELAARVGGTPDPDGDTLDAAGPGAASLLDEFIADFAEATVVGFDTEETPHDPYFRQGGAPQGHTAAPPHLIQLASTRRVWVIDTTEPAFTALRPSTVGGWKQSTTTCDPNLRLPGQMPIPPVVAEVLTRPSVTLVGFGIERDAHLVARRMNLPHDGNAALRPLDLGAVFKTRHGLGAATLSDVTPSYGAARPAAEPVGTAQACARLLRQRVAKVKDIRCSDWAKRPLSGPQVAYAAIDAAVALLSFVALEARNRP